MRQDNAALASMVAAVDDSVGALTAKLDQLGLTENTVIIFFSDNGGLSTPAPAPVRGATRPCGPARAGSTKAEYANRPSSGLPASGPGSVCDDPVVSMDFFPTMLELAGLPSS